LSNAQDSSVQKLFNRLSLIPFLWNNGGLSECQWDHSN